MSERILLAIDAGGTRTRCAVASSSGRLLGAGAGGPANHILSGWEQARTSIGAAVAAAHAAAGAPHLDAAVAGSAGVGANGEGREVVESLLRELLPRADRVEAIGDMVVSFWGALRVPVGVVVSAGTGSVCFARNAAGTTRQVGGWGHLMGDEGSAYDVAVQALRAVAQATDGRGAATRLSETLPRRAGVDSALGLALHVYGGSFSRDRIAAFSADVADAAGSGDAVAADILRRAAADLALAAVTAARVLDLREPVVSWAGSVFDAGSVVLESFESAIVRALPAARLQRPLLPPLGGALRLALAACDESATDELIERWRESLRGAA